MKKFFNIGAGLRSQPLKMRMLWYNEMNYKRKQFQGRFWIIHSYIAQGFHDWKPYVIIKQSIITKTNCFTGSFDDCKTAWNYDYAEHDAVFDGRICIRS